MSFKSFKSLQIKSKRQFSPAKITCLINMKVDTFEPFEISKYKMNVGEITFK